MHTFKLLKTLLKINVQMSLAYRADTIINIFISLLWLGWDFLSLNIIFSNTTTLGGWNIGELITLLGVFRLVNTYMATLIWPNTERFNASVRDGSLDYTLLQPVNSLFMVSFSRITIWRSWEVILSVILIAAGLNMNDSHASLTNLLIFVVLIISGSLVIYSLWVVLIALTFWFTKFDNNVTILQALLDSGRFPSTVYPAWLRIIVTFIIPIAVATTVPLQGLRGDLGPWQIGMFLGVSAAAFLISVQVWKLGLGRYSGASS